MKRSIKNLGDDERAKKIKAWAADECARITPHYENLLEYLQFADRDENDQLITNLVVFLYGRSVPGRVFPATETPHGQVGGTRKESPVQQRTTSSMYFWKFFRGAA